MCRWLAEVVGVTLAEADVARQAVDARCRSAPPRLTARTSRQQNLPSHDLRSGELRPNVSGNRPRLRPPKDGRWTRSG
jgi:hypothetical protein